MFITVTAFLSGKTLQNLMQKYTILYCLRSLSTETVNLISGVMLQIEDDAYQEDLGFSLGQLGKSGSGRVRQAQVNEATKARISKSLQVS